MSDYRPLHLPENLKITGKVPPPSWNLHAGDTPFSIEPGQFLNGWDQTHRVGLGYQGTGTKSVIEIFIEPSFPFVKAFLFKDTSNDYDDENADPAFSELKNYFYNNLHEDLKLEFTQNLTGKKTVTSTPTWLSMIIIPRDVEMTRNITCDNLRTKTSETKTSETKKSEIKRYMCKVTVVDEGASASEHSMSMGVKTVYHSASMGEPSIKRKTQSTKSKAVKAHQQTTKAKPKKPTKQYKKGGTRSNKTKKRQR